MVGGVVGRSVTAGSSHLQGPEDWQGQTPAGTLEHALVHSSPDGADASPSTGTATQLKGCGVGAPVVGKAVVTGDAVGARNPDVVVGVGAAVVGAGGPPPPLPTIDMSTQFLNSSPQPHLLQPPPGQEPPRPQLAEEYPLASSSPLKQA